MSKQDKDNLGDFFRDRAQFSNIEFDESDWQKLEQLLDAELPVSNIILSFLKKYWYIILLALSLPIAWLWIDKADQFNGDIILQSSERIQKPEQELNEESEVKYTDESYASGQQSESSISVNDDSEDQKSEKRIDDVVVREELVRSKHLASEFGSNTGKDIGYVVFENGVKSGILDFKLHFLSAIPPAFSINGADHQIKYVKEPLEIIASPKSFKRSVNVGVGYSPDFSTVGNAGFVSPGTRWTILAEMEVFRRLLINTGVVWVNNKYEAYGEDYHAPSRYWKKGIVADEAYGECKMIDIPLNLRYNFFVKGKNQLFVSAGASTYFVLKEDYYFHYEYEDPELPDHWGTDKMTAYPFSILNFSFGFQHDITAKSSFHIEPFVKIPTIGIGWGNVDLNTVGVYFMYKYKVGNQQR